ncbi:MAG: hypothetical protein FJZ43_03565 [Candidatus Staskawiczbacteria bacterium]|nr:hypothetical protein [Candidatus Staskawiczbacteria bacterium]
MEKESKYCDILLTDIQLHTIKPTNPPSLARVIAKFLRNGLPGRIYSTFFQVQKDNKENPLRLSIPLTKEWEDKVTELEKAGKKIRFIIPGGGIPIYAGKDMIEFMKAKKNRILKRI